MNQASRVRTRPGERQRERIFDPPAVSVEPASQTLAPAENPVPYSIGTTDILPGVRPVAQKVQRKEDDAANDRSEPTAAPPPPPESPAASPDPLSAARAGTTVVQAPIVGLTTYSGRTLTDVASALPEEPGSVTFDIRTATDGDPVTRATVTVTQTMLLPRWAERDTQCKPVQAAWDRFAHALRQHEDQHVAINRTTLESAHTHYVGKPQDNTQDVTTDLQDKAQAANDAFDTRTDHGRRGSPPTTIDLGTKCDDKKASMDSGGDEEPVQTKLEVSAPGDPDEEEADRVADQVMRMTDRGESPAIRARGDATIVSRCAACDAEEERWKGSGGAASGVDTPRKCAACEAEDEKRRTSRSPRTDGEEEQQNQRVLRKEATGHPVVDDTSRVAAVARSGGVPLDASTRAFMEPRFGFDFSRVRVHADAPSAEAAESINAHAYTLGSDIVFAAGRYAPADRDGRRLLAHELTHVVQQSVLAPRTLEPSRSDAPEVSIEPAGREERSVDAAAPSGERVQRDTDTADAPVDVDAPTFVDHHGPAIRDGLVARMPSAELPTATPMVSWTAGTSKEVVGQAVQQVLPPADGLWNRLVAIAAPGAPPAGDVDRGRGVKPGSTGPDVFDPKVVEALHLVLMPRLEESLHRTLPRYVIARNQAMLREEERTKAQPAVAPEPPDTDVLVSHPFDAALRTAFAGKVVIDFPSFRQANPNEARIHGTTPLRPLTEFKFALEEPASRKGVWNWLRVIAPADATAEEVAASIYGDAALASLITPGMPWYGFREDRLVPACRERWDKAAAAAGGTKDPSGTNDPAQQALAGPLADAVAKAQAANLKPTGAQSGEIVQRMRAAQGLVSDFKSKLSAKPALAGQVGQLEPLLTRLDERSRQVNDAPEQAVTWDGQSAAQLSVLSQAGDGLQLALAGADAFAGDRNASNPIAQAQAARLRAPLQALSQAFVDVVITSDLTAVSNAKLGIARQQLQRYPIAVSSAILASIEEALAQAEANKSVSAGTLSDLSRRAATMRSRIAQAGDLLVSDPAAAQKLLADAQTDIQNLQTRSSFVTNMDACNAAAQELKKLLGRNRTVSRLAGTEADYIKAKADVDAWYARWEEVYKQYEKESKPGQFVDMGLPEHVDTSSAEGKFRELSTAPQWVGKFQRIRTLLEDDQAIEQWVTVGVMIGIAGLSALSGGLAGGGAVGLVVEAGAFTAMSAAILQSDPTVGTLVVDFGANLAMFGAMRLFGAAFAGVFGKAFAGSAVGQGIQLVTIATGMAAQRLLTADTEARAGGAAGVDSATSSRIVLLTFVESLGMAVAGHASRRLLEGSPVRGTANLKDRFAALDASDDKLGAQAEALQTQAGARANIGGAATPTGDVVARAKTLVDADRHNLDQKQQVLTDIETMIKSGTKVEGLTPEQLAELQHGLGKQADAAKLSRILLELQPAGPGRFLCDEATLAARRAELASLGYTETAVTADPVTQATSVTLKPPDGSEALTITSTKGSASKVAAAPLPPVSSDGAVWDLPSDKRGLAIEHAMGKLYKTMGGGVRRMPPGFKACDFTIGGETTIERDAAGNRVWEIIDGPDILNERSVNLTKNNGMPQDRKGILDAFNGHLEKLINFEGGERKKVGLEVRNPRNKLLNLHVGRGEPSPEQWSAIDECSQIAAVNKVILNIIKF